MSLTEYRRKRDFRRTREPRGKVRRRTGALSFVVQKHDASHLHYDFRLELDGVLKSWAVPKGPDLDPATKRLAMAVEDHPVEYGGFEGIIPEGEYGGGTVMLWDRGTWEPLDDDPQASLRAGRLKFTLHGEKLRGNWMLVRRGGRGTDGDERHWFLFKERDRFARASGKPITDRLPRSVATRRDLAEIAAQADRVWGAKGEIRQRKNRPAMTADSKRGAAGDDDNVDGATFAGVTLSNPHKVLYPDQGLTKADLASYYAAIADWILPHIVDRPLALVRCPSGSGKKCFFQKHPSEGQSEFLSEVNVAESGPPEYNMAVADVAGLMALVQMGVLEIHVWGSRARALEKPDRLVFDLDPDPSVPWGQVVSAAREVRLVLQELGLESFLKTTGGKGLHLVVPIQARTPWDEAKAFCKGVAELIAQAAPERYVVNMSKAKRKGKIFVDYLRNGRGATSIAPYSTRAKPGATVSVPITWEELSAKLKSDQFTVENLPRRLAQRKRDPWEQLPHTRQSITKAMIRRLREEYGLGD